MKVYYDQNTDVTCKDTMTVHEETREALVKYASPTGTFTVRVRQKPNPIGFHARLPGDRNHGWYQPRAGRGVGPAPMVHKK